MKVYQKSGINSTPIKERVLKKLVLFTMVLFVFSKLIIPKAQAESLSDLFTYSASARDFALGNIGETLPYNPTGLFGNPASISGISGIEYSEMYLPLCDKDIYIHSAALIYSHGKLTEFIGAKIGFSAPAQENRYFNFNFPGNNLRMGIFGLAYAVTPQLIAGFSGNICQNRLQSHKEVMLRANIGAQFRLGLLTLSTSVKNLGARKDGNTGSDMIGLSQCFSSGAHLSLFNGVIGIGGDIELSEMGEISNYSIGSEFTFGNFLSLRGSCENPGQKLAFNGDDIESELFAVGCGIRLGEVAIDYAIKEHPQAQDDYMHLVTFGLNGKYFGRNKVKDSR